MRVRRRPIWEKLCPRASRWRLREWFSAGGMGGPRRQRAPVAVLVDGPRARIRRGSVAVIDGGPVVRLRSATERPYDDAIAAARTCYSPRVVGPEEITEGQRDRIGPLTFADDRGAEREECDGG